MTDYDKKATEEVQAMLQKLGLPPLVLDDIEDKPVENLKLKEVFPDCSDIPIGDGIVKAVTIPDGHREVVVVFYMHENRERKLVREMPLNVLLVAGETELI